MNGLKDIIKTRNEINTALTKKTGFFFMQKKIKINKLLLKDAGTSTG